MLQFKIKLQCNIAFQVLVVRFYAVRRLSLPLGWWLHLLIGWKSSLRPGARFFELLDLVHILDFNRALLFEDLTPFWPFKSSGRHTLWHISSKWKGKVNMSTAQRSSLLHYIPDWWHVFKKVYNAEIAHPEMRGSLGAIIPAMASLGTLYTFLVSFSSKIN